MRCKKCGGLMQAKSVTYDTELQICSACGRDNIERRVPGHLDTASDVPPNTSCNITYVKLNNDQNNNLTGLGLITREKKRLQENNDLSVTDKTLRIHPHIFGSSAMLCLGNYSSYFPQYARGDKEVYSRRSTSWGIGVWPITSDRGVYKPKNPLYDLVLAGVLICTEIDRLIAEQPDMVKIYLKELKLDISL